jgi:hypothetical protein
LQDFFQLNFDKRHHIFSKLNSLIHSIIELSAGKTSQYFFGNELAHAHLVSQYSNLVYADLARRYFFRPACEPIVSSFYTSIQEGSFNFSSYVQLASSLTLCEITLRGNSSARLSLNDTEFLETKSETKPVDAIQQLIGLNSPIKVIDTSVFVSVLAITILHQPLVNSNSRTITAFLNLLLMKKYELAGPPISLGPSFVVRPELTFRALQELYLHNKWNAFVNLLEIALEECLLSKRKDRDL